MGFWNALSVLAPVAPALSDAQDIRTARQQDAAKFAQDQQLHDAQMTTQKMAAQEAQQRIRAGNQPMFKSGSQPEFNPTSGTYQQPVWDDKKQAYSMMDVPGVSPEEQERYQLDSLKKNRAAAKEMMPDAKPEDLDYLAYTLSGIKPPVAKVTQLTGDAGKTYKGADGQYYVSEKDETGAIIAKPMGANYQPPAPKATSPSSIYTNLLAKQILANKKQGPPLTNEEAAQLQSSQSALTVAGVARSVAWAQAAAANHLVSVTDPDTGMDTLIPVAAGVAAYNQGAPLLAGAVSAPTGMDKKNSMLAQSALQQVNRMQAILKADPNLVGPGSGQLTKLQMWLGTQDPDAQQFLISSLLGSEHGVAVFGGRNIHTIQDLNNALGSMKTNPAALSGALDVVKETMAPWATAGGRLPEPRTAGGGTGGGNAANKQHSLRTAMALPFNKGKSAAQVKSDLESHGYTVVP